MKTLSQTYPRVAAVVFLALSVLVTAPASAAEDAGYRVIVHKSNPLNSITKDQLSQLLLKKRSRWAHGPAVEPVDLAPTSTVREAFSKDVHGRSVSSIKNYWQRQIFSGRDVPPPEASSDAEAITFVQSHPGGIGYVSAKTTLDGVKLLNLASK